LENVEMAASIREKQHGLAIAQPSSGPIHPIIKSQTSRGIQPEPVGFQIPDIHITLVGFSDESDTFPIRGWAQIKQGKASPVRKSP
jgi:hypothetical protein